MRDLRELDDPQIGSDLWLERLDTFAGEEIASGTEDFVRLLEAFRKIQGTFIPFE